MSGTSPEELAQTANRHRQRSDAAKLIPFVAGVLILIPVLWASGSKTSSALMYIFLVWLLLIILNGALSLALSKRRSRGAEPRS